MTPQALAETLRHGAVAIIGDVILDHYVTGSVGRISPEAPVPVMHAEADRFVLGGAANVAANVAALGGRVRLIGAVGADQAGERIAKLTAASPGLDARLERVQDRPTTLKTRYVSGQQQMLRVDREALAPLPAATVEALRQAALEALETFEVLILSDYGKGVLCDPVLAAALRSASAQGKVTIVDPKRPSFLAYRGAAYITPNRTELAQATGLACAQDEDALIAAEAAMAQSGASILLTRSEKGMSLYRPGCAPLHAAAQAREVFDVSGAGDTVVAGLALGLSAGLAVGEALSLANAAAGVVVGKLGTAVCTLEELARALSREREPASASPSPQTGLTSLAEASARRAQWGKEGLKVGFANGCFDLLHPGHVSLLRQAAQACDRLIVAINTDASVRRLKGPTRPVQNQQARAAVLSGLRDVDLVIAFDEDTPLNVITALQPDVLVKGADYTEQEVVGAELVKARGGRVLLAALEPGCSTSALVRRAGEPTADQPLQSSASPAAQTHRPD